MVPAASTRNKADRARVRSVTRTRGGLLLDVIAIGVLILLALAAEAAHSIGFGSLAREVAQRGGRLLHQSLSALLGRAL